MSTTLLNVFCLVSPKPDSKSPNKVFVTCRDQLSGDLTAELTFSNPADFWGFVSDLAVCGVEAWGAKPEGLS